MRKKLSLDHQFILWGIPLLAMLVVLLVSQSTRPLVDTVIVSPFGLVENLPTIFLAIGVWYAIQVSQLSQAQKLRGWIIAYAVALIYFAGEDQNWFQYWMGAEVPDYFLLHNKEQEINLHNMSTWFNQKPRIVVDLWVLIACVLVPMGWWTWPKRAAKKWIPEALWPDKRIVPIAMISLGVGWFGTLCDHLIANVDQAKWHFSATDIMTELFPAVRISELQEIGYAYVMMLYAALLCQRLRTKRKK